MKQALFWQDAYQTQFEATVLECVPHKERFALRLSQTLFYPTAGGQPHDTGHLSINGQQLEVLEVLERPKGEHIWHVVGQAVEVGHTLEQTLPPSDVNSRIASLMGGSLEGNINWNRRYRHMQRHTAQHILAQAVLRVCGMGTNSVDMSNPECRIDIQGVVSPDVIAQIEHEANTVVRQARAVYSQIGSHEATRSNLWTQNDHTTRTVHIADYDIAPCAGTHVKSTSELGIIKLLKHQVYQHTTRLYFCTGQDALEDYQAKHQILLSSSQQLSCKPLEVHQRLLGLRAELNQSKQYGFDIRDALAERIMQSILTEFNHNPHQLTVAAIVPEAVLEEVAKRLVEWPNMLAVLFAQTSNTTKYMVVQHQERKQDLSAIVDVVLKPLGAKGGGVLMKLGVLPKQQAHQAIKQFWQWWNTAPSR